MIWNCFHIIVYTTNDFYQSNNEKIKKNQSLTIDYMLIENIKNYS